LIERTTKSKMKRMTPPTHQKAKQGQKQAAADKIMETMAQKDSKSYHQTTNELMKEHDSITVVAAALKTLTKERRNITGRITTITQVSDKKAQRSNNNNRRSNNKRFQGKRGKGGWNNKRRKQGGRSRKGNFQKRR